MACKGEIVSGTYQWEITDYKQYQVYESGQFIQSPEFSIGSHTWHLKLYPRGQNTEDNDIISLVAQVGKSEVIRVGFSLTILNLDGKVLTKKSEDEKVCIESCWCVSNMINICKIKEPIMFLTESKFIILCEIRMGNSNMYDKLVASQSKRLHQFQKFEPLLNNEEFSDVKFTIENKQLWAHKVILSSSSEVFAAMFKHKMKESTENVVEIEGISYEVIHELFRFIYSGQATKKIEIAQELLAAADKYQVLELKSICEQQLCDDLSINNAINYLSFSNIHGAHKLKKNAISFVVKNIDSITELKEFDSFMCLDAAVVKDILREFSSINKSLSKSLEAYREPIILARPLRWQYAVDSSRV